AWVSAVWLGGGLLDAARGLPDNSPADGATASSLLDDPPGQGRPIATPPGSRGSGCRARWAVMHRGGADVASRSSSIPLGVDYRAILEKGGRTSIRAVVRVP